MINLLSILFAGLCIGVIVSAVIVIELTPFVRKAKAQRRKAANRRRKGLNKAKAYVILSSNI